MAERNRPGVAKVQERILVVLVGAWFASKVYRGYLLEKYGLFSAELWRADTIIAGVLVVVGVVAFRIARHRYQARSNDDQAGGSSDSGETPR